MSTFYPGMLMNASGVTLLMSQQVHNFTHEEASEIWSKIDQTQFDSIFEETPSSELVDAIRSEMLRQVTDMGMINSGFVPR